MSRYPWRDTSSDIAGGQPPQWETPGGAQAKADKAEEESKKYTDEKNADFTAHVQNATIHVMQSDKDNWNSKASGVHTHANATPTMPGFESAADKTKLDGIEEGANNYVHPATHPPSIIVQDTSNRFVTDAEKAAWNAKAETTTASPAAKGLMSSADKTKLDGVESGAEVNQNAFAMIKAPGQGDVIAGSKQETINFAGGTGITVTTDPAGKKVMITATGEATPGPHASSHITGGTDIIPDAVVGGASGLMSGADADFVRNTGETKTGAQAKADAAKTEAVAEANTYVNDVIYQRFGIARNIPITLQPGVQIVKADRQAVFSLTGLTGKTVIDYDGQKGVFGVRNPYAIRYGENLLPSFYEWTVHSNAKVTSPNALSLVTAQSTQELSYYDCRAVIVGQKYTVSFQGTGKAIISFVDATNSAPTRVIVSSATPVTFTVPNGTVYIRVYVGNLISYTDENNPSTYTYAAGTYTFSNMMLNIGSVAKPFKLREDSMLALQTDLYADPVTGANADTVFERDGQYFKSKKWHRVILDGTITQSFFGSGAGFKAVNGLLPVAPALDGSGLLTKYQGRFIKETDYATVSSGADQLNIGSSGANGVFDNFQISISSADSGWGDNYTPSTEEIKAYFMGWKMYDTSVGSTVAPYNRTDGQSKGWVRRRLSDGAFVDGSGTLPTTQAAEYTPYKLVYQLATPTVEPIVSEGQLTFIEGENQVEVGTGIVLRESVKPHLDTNSKTYSVNAEGYPSPLKYKSKGFFANYESGYQFFGWNVNTAVLQGNGPWLQAVQDGFDASGSYSTTYFMRDLSPVVAFTGNYAANEKTLLMDLVDSVQQNTARVSVLENKKADKDSPSWIAPAGLRNGWIKYTLSSGSILDVGYYRDSASVVYLRGAVKNGLTSVGNDIFVLPEGYRPKFNRNFSVISGAESGPVIARIEVRPNGVVAFIYGGNSLLSFDGIAFLAEQ
ncbi:hypothetical protein ACIFQM_17590 [Paenibacillus sp. NRS-1782]|uniref:hypothetical protein n=1 Tax=unclassified Paenibacillus TaxID=185978 RepID=UPI003D2DBFF8